MNIPKRRRKLKIFVPIASMGDIAFLLIIFFMLTSKFMKESNIEYKQAASPDIDKLEDIGISVIVDKEGKIWLQGKECGSPDELQSGVQALVANTKDKIVMVKVDKDITEQFFGPVLMSLSKAGVKIALTGEKSKYYTRKN